MPTLQETIRKVRTRFGTQTTTPQISAKIKSPFFEPTPKVRFRDVAREIPETLKRVRKFVLPSRTEILAEIQEERKQTLLPDEAKKAILEREEEMFIMRLPTPPDSSFTKFLEQKEVLFTGAGVVKRVTPKKLKETLKKIRKEPITDLEPLATQARKLTKVSDTILEDIPLSKLEIVEAGPRGAGISRTKGPIEAVFNPNTNKFEILDGATRFEEALARGDKTIATRIQFGEFLPDGGINRISPADFFNRAKAVKKPKRD